MLKFKPEFMFELKLNALKLLNVKLTLRRKEKFVFKAPLKIDVLIEPYGTIIHYLFLSLDPSESESLFIRHLDGTNNKISNNFKYNRTFTLLEDPYS